MTLLTPAQLVFFPSILSFDWVSCRFPPHIDKLSLTHSESKTHERKEEQAHPNLCCDKETNTHAHCIYATPILLLMWQTATRLYHTCERVYVRLCWAGRHSRVPHNSYGMFLQYLFSLFGWNGNHCSIRYTFSSWFVACFTLFVYALDAEVQFNFHLLSASLTSLFARLQFSFCYDAYTCGASEWEKSCGHSACCGCEYFARLNLNVLWVIVNCAPIWYSIDKYLSESM